MLILTIYSFLQAVPIPLSWASAVKQIFILAAEKLGFQFVTIRSKFGFPNRPLSPCGIWFVLAPQVWFPNPMGDNK